MVLLLPVPFFYIKLFILRTLTLQGLIKCCGGKAGFSQAFNEHSAINQPLSPHPSQYKSPLLPTNCAVILVLSRHRRRQHLYHKPQ